MKKKLFLNNVDENTMNQSISCEFGPDGVRFIRAGLKVTKEGMSKVTGGQIMPLSIVKADDIEFGVYIGRGATGIVQKGIYKPNNFPIAIKTINVYDKHKRHQVMNDLKVYLSDIFTKGSTSMDEEMMRYLVQLYGAYFDEGSIKIILELMDVGSLRDILDMARQLKTDPPYIEEPYLANIAYQMLNGLNYLHGKKHQIHRDVKPENVLMNSLGQVKLTDFGISKELEKTIDVCKTFVGTMTYMSPERVEGKPYTYSSDIWSFGLMLIELITGDFPFGRGKTFIEMLQTILMSKEPSLPDNGLYSAELIDFIRLCMNKEPNKRATAYELLQHKWLLVNSELNKDLSEWITNIIFTCKYEKISEERTQYSNLKQKGSVNSEKNMNGTSDVKPEPSMIGMDNMQNNNTIFGGGIGMNGYKNNNNSNGGTIGHGMGAFLPSNGNSFTEKFEVPKSKVKSQTQTNCDMEVEILE